MGLKKAYDILVPRPKTAMIRTALTRLLLGFQVRPLMIQMRHLSTCTHVS